MVYGKSYRQIINFNEYTDQEKFEKELLELCNNHKAVLFDEKGTQMNNV